MTTFRNRHTPDDAGSVRGMNKIIVVGAGTAGCTAAARLSEDANNHVVLLESGPDNGPGGGSAGLQSVNWIRALEAETAFYDDLFARKLAGDEPRPYRRGRGVGGSASVNAMLAVPGLPVDYNNYRTKYGLDRWDWKHVEPWLAKLKPVLTVSTEDEITPVDRALIESAKHLGLASWIDTYSPEPAEGAGLLWRNADRKARKSSLELHLDPSRGRSNLEIHADSRVDRLIIHDSVAKGVLLADGTEIYADDIILCAGSFESPAILLRSGLTRHGIGKGLQDHPATSIYLSLKPGFGNFDLSKPCIGAVMRLSSSVGEGDIHLLPLWGTLIDSQPASHGLLMAAVMRVTSFGELRLNEDNPLAPPVIEERMLTTAHDRTVMREAIAAAEKVLATPPFADIVEAAFLDADGTPLSALQDDEFFERWLSTTVGDYFHAVGTARMGDAEDEDAVVDDLGRIHGLSGVAIWDASILPEVPRANTHTPVSMVAERLSNAYRTGELT